MNLNYSTNQLIKVKDIVIPERFYNRMKTGYDSIDKLFGNGILQGLTFTLAASPGTGKTTFLLQLLDSLESQGYKTGYFTGEEDIRQVAFTCKRINVTEVPICNVTDIDKICEMTKDLDIIVLDSFPCITTKEEMSRNIREKYIVEKLVEASELNNCAIGIILHVTKTGDYKGGTLIPHAVGANFMLEVDQSDIDNSRVVSSSKNRYGSTVNIAIPFGVNGFAFDHANDHVGSNNPPSKSETKTKLLTQILNMAEPPGLTMRRVMEELDIDQSKAYFLLRELITAGKLQKFGRGDSAMYKHTDVTVAE